MKIIIEDKSEIKKDRVITLGKWIGSLYKFKVRITIQKKRLTTLKENWTLQFWHERHRFPSETYVSRVFLKKEEKTAKKNSMKQYTMLKRKGSLLKWAFKLSKNQAKKAGQLIHSTYAVLWKQIL